MMTAEKAMETMMQALMAHKAETEERERVSFRSAGALRRPVRPEEYAPYHEMKEFDEGCEAYFEGRQSPYGTKGVAAQAWDRGYEFAMRTARERERQPEEVR